jgi:hypothetical protein
MASQRLAACRAALGVAIGCATANGSETWPAVIVSARL